MAEGQRFGPFEVLGPIAQGGQGAVLRARRLHDGAAVALKLLLRPDPRTVRRFRQEAQVLERLDHPSIVRLVGHGEEQGVPWLAMELIDGQSLRALVAATGPPPFGFTVRTLEALARALAACHAQGIVHRDLKPDNVLVERGTERPVLVDFGLLARDAEVFGELSLDQLSRLSTTGELKGTPSYMAPEQAAPKRFGPVGPQADVYALGATLHFLLTGAPPHTAGALPALIKKIIDEDPPDPRALNPAVPPGLATLCRRALSKLPGERPPSMTALADALAALREECAAADTVARRRPISSVLPSPPPPARATPAPTPLLGAGGPGRGPTVRPGSVVGPYEVLSLLGQGGMGTVFRARHRELGTVRALKVLSAGTDASRRARFLREVQLLARARHEHVVTIHEADTDGLVCWFAMDLVEGEPLDRVLARGRPPLDRALALAVGIGRGVQALHALGIVHRDLKPQNVIVTPDDRPVVIDLGLAVDPQRDERLTRTGAFVGTIRYMAPEQLSGVATERTDVYALGLIAFELITGRPALDEAGSVTELTARILTEDRPGPGAVDPSLGTNLDAVIAAACARDPERRPANAGAFADRLEQATLDPGRPVTSRRRRRRAVGALAASALVAGLVGATLALAPRAPDRPPPLTTDGPVGPVDPATDARALGDASRAARAVRERDLPATEVLRRADEWLARFGALGAPEHDEVLALRRAARREVPLLTKVHRSGREARAQWLDGGARLVVWGRDHDVVALWDADGAELRRWELGTPVLSLVADPDGRSLVVATRAAPWLQRLDLASGALAPGPALDPPPDAPFNALALAPDGRLLAIGDLSGGLRLVEAATGRDVARVAAHRSPVRCVAFTPDGGRVVSGSGDWVDNRAAAADNGLKVWDAASLAPRAATTLGAVPYFALFGPDARRFAVGISAYRLYMFDVDALDADPLELQGSGTESMTLGLGAPSAHRGAVRAAAFGPGGRLYSVGGERGDVRDADNELRAWDVERGQEVVSAKRALPDVPISVAVAPDGRVAVGFQGGSVQVFAPDE